MSNIGFEVVAVSSSAVGLANIPTLPDWVGLIEVIFQTDEEVRVRMDGTDPTSAYGKILYPVPLEYIHTTRPGNNDLTNLRMIRVSSDAVVQVEYNGY